MGEPVNGNDGAMKQAARILELTETIRAKAMGPSKQLPRDLVVALAQALESGLGRKPKPAEFFAAAAWAEDCLCKAATVALVRQGRMVLGLDEHGRVVFGLAPLVRPVTVIPGGRAQ